MCYISSIVILSFFVVSHQLALASLISQYEIIKFMQEKELLKQTTTLRPFKLLSTKSSDLLANPGKDCLRPCTLTGAPKICYFKWTLEFYQTMGSACHNCSDGNHTDCFHPQCVTADGVERGFMSINRKFPGPNIEICQGDLLIVDVDNHMAGTSTSIHWHGILQPMTNYMDGVAMVTQCPITYYTSFRYHFVAEIPGTHHYHSHAGHHKSNGITGTLIIREPRENDPNSDLYDYDLSDHIMFTNDWLHDYAETFVPGLSKRPLEPKSLLINGKGRFNKNDTNVPYAIFRVKSGGRYKFRLINSIALTCALKLQIQQHQLMIIATDSNQLKPIVVDTLIYASGERYEFVLVANQSPGNYWVRLTAIGPCDELKLEQFAILSYASASTLTDIDLAFTNQTTPTFDEKYPDGVVLNHPNATSSKWTLNANGNPTDDVITRNSGGVDDSAGAKSNGASDDNVDGANKSRETNGTFICISDLESQLVTDDELINGVPDHQFFLGFKTAPISDDVLFNDDDKYYHYYTGHGNVNSVGVINNISFVLSQFLTKVETINENQFCDETNKPLECKVAPQSTQTVQLSTFKTQSTPCSMQSNNTSTYVASRSKVSTSGRNSRPLPLPLPSSMPVSLTTPLSSLWSPSVSSSTLLTASSKVLNDTQTNANRDLNIESTNIDMSGGGGNSTNNNETSKNTGETSCTNSTGDNVSSSEASTNICFCLHRIKVKLNSIVELVLVDEAEVAGTLNHPFHLHGHRFVVKRIGFAADIAQLRTGSTEATAAAAAASRNISIGTGHNPLLINIPRGHSPPHKDTVSVPSKGYAILRFRVDNPGFWLLHCHFEWHLNIGMNLILQVGEPSEMPLPPNDFPVCGNYLPTVLMR